MVIGAQTVCAVSVSKLGLLKLYTLFGTIDMKALLRGGHGGLDYCSVLIISSGQDTGKGH